MVSSCMASLCFLTSEEIVDVYLHLCALYVCTMSMSGTWGGQKKVLDYLELKLWMDVSQCRVWETEPLQDQQGFLTTEQSHQPLIF